MEPEPKTFTFHPANLGAAQITALKQLDENQFLPRLWQHDYTLWSDQPDEITNRLDWLELPDNMMDKIDDLTRFAKELASSGFKTAVLLGMGGSSLAPEVFKKVFGPQPGFLDLVVLDTTDPVTIRNAQEDLDLAKTVFIVATKSGGTAETLSLFKYFYNQLDADPQISTPGDQFVAITDPGSKLEKLAADLGFRRTFLNNPNLGGRYSALSDFGLVPAACLGVDLKTLLSSAGSAGEQNNATSSSADSPAAALGALIGAGFHVGVDKVTFISSTEIAPFSDWVEQLIAESTGKIGKGILPVVGEPVPDDLSVYSQDRIFVIQQFGESPVLQKLAADLRSAGFPVVETHIQSPYQLGELILTWEIAIAIVGRLIGIHPFNQPDVESAKVMARKSVQAFMETGELPERMVEIASAEKINAFVAKAKENDYISLQAYLPMTPEIEALFRQMQAKLRDHYHHAVTFGFGPRFLHSTGQLHKGDGGHGNFIQFVTSSSFDLDIPDQAGQPESGISFDTLKQAQAIGDGAALEAKGRRLLVLSLDAPLTGSLTHLVESL
ncbi:MAG: glucose-6-phosphate isomerase [Anaerolineales bacterium]